MTSFTKIFKKADLEGSLAVLHSEEAANLTPSRYILLVESGLIDITELVLWPNRERRKLSVLLVINYGESNALDRSITTTAISFLLSRAWHQSSVNFNKEEQQECPRRNPDILFEKTGVNTLYN